MAQTLVLNVTRRAPELIPPARPTPYEFKELSDIDDQEGLRFQAPVIQFYRNNNESGSHHAGRDPATVVKAAAAKALVSYYPFAGRLREKEGRKLVVECNGEGILFIQAYADVTLDDFGEIIKPPFPLDQLLFDVPGSTAVLDNPLLLIQVTRLKCGGFILALRLNHTMADAAGIILFLKAMVEFAQGAQSPSVQPVWERHLLRARNPAQITCQHREYEQVPDTKGTIIPLDDMVHKSFFFGPTEIAALKRYIPPHTKATTFEILTACLWRCCTIALQPDPEEQVRIMCIVNFRGLFNPPLIPSGYYGNAFAFPVAITTAAELSTNPVSYALNLVKRAKADVTQEYVHSLADFMVLKGRPHITVVRTFVVSDVTQAGFMDMDFGWGQPVFSGPAKSGIGAIPGVSSFYIRFINRKGEKGTVVPLCLPGNAMEIFVKELNRLLSQSSDHQVGTSKSKYFITSSI